MERSVQVTNSDKRVDRGVWLAIFAGIVALGVMVIWPQWKHQTLTILDNVWLVAVTYASWGQWSTGVLKLTPGQIYQKIRGGDTSFRTPFQVTLITLAMMVLMIYLMFHPA